MNGHEIDASSYDSSQMVGDSEEIQICTYYLGDTNFICTRLKLQKIYVITIYSGNSLTSEPDNTEFLITSSTSLSPKMTFNIITLSDNTKFW